ncbi:Myc-type basic helix-loop-helix (bHLH) domain-containing protein [Dioscorea alata]|uniref:Myc-type basic helix-loop-helix (BHLH) domain-containing protein n=1 Tax=Dioscorea alata TaxID=55571 RepID=A0ACB7UP71_DIOAL|nr:Myc-type basic helix-loop-helix (bHLH) domain-containing protein [Dioscorea alata]
MSDEFQTCNGRWWNTPRNFVAPPISCSTAITDTGAGAGAGAGFSWASSETVELMEVKQMSGEEPVPSCSGSSVTYQETHKIDAARAASAAVMMDASLQVPTFGLSSPMTDWNQALLGRSSGRGETSFHAMLQEGMPMDGNQEQRNTDHEGSSVNLFKDMNHGYLLEQHQYTLVPSSYGYSSSSCSSSQALTQQPLDYESSSMGYRSNELLQPSWTKFPQFLKSSPVKQPPCNQLNFSNSTPFWNPSTGVATDVRPPFYSSLSSQQFIPQSLEQKPISNSLTIKTNSEAMVRDSSSGMKKSNSDQPSTFKKPRIETPSPVPTFKVRKEKLGDRITALQQLVSPFGKTDTASVLHEAIEYIKFLHEQVGVLSTSYLKNGHPMQQHQSSEKAKDGEGPKQDLRSRGLCLVPISSTFPVASENPADFWTSTYGGTYR